MYFILCFHPLKQIQVQVNICNFVVLFCFFTAGDVLGSESAPTVKKAGVSGVSKNAATVPQPAVAAPQTSTLAPEQSKTVADVPDEMEENLLCTVCQEILHDCVRYVQDLSPHNALVVPSSFRTVRFVRSCFILATIICVCRVDVCDSVGFCSVASRVCIPSAAAVTPTGCNGPATVPQYVHVPMFICKVSYAVCYAQHVCMKY